MKHPISNITNLNEEDNEGTVTEEEVIAAQNKAIKARQEAIDLRAKLEGLEALLAKTKQCIASANTRILEKDREIVKVQAEAKNLGKSVLGLEERFQKLKVLQNELAAKRKEMGFD